MFTTTIYFAISDEIIYYKISTGGKVMGGTPKVNVSSDREFEYYLKALQNEIEAKQNEIDPNKKFKFINAVKGTFTGTNWDGNIYVRFCHPVTQQWTTFSWGKTKITYKLLPKTSSNGWVSLTHFEDSMLSVLKRLHSPIFAVIDHNSAHHLSYILAKKAFTTAHTDGKRNKVVINFDNHADGNPPVKGAEDPPNYIHCNNWAYQLFRDASAKNLVYISVGAHDQKLFSGHPAGKTLIWHGEGKNHADTDILTEVIHPDGTRDTNIEHILDTVEGAVKGKMDNFSWGTADVYVTVDRDFMKGSLTPYGDGEYLPVVGRNAVKSCLTYLGKNKKAKLVGFDVIGLPGEGGGKRSTYLEVEKKLEPRDVKLLAIQESIIDITEFYKSVSDYVGTSISEPISIAASSAAAGSAADTPPPG